MALADIYVLEDKQLWRASEEMLNIFTFQRLAPEGTAMDCIEAYLESRMSLTLLLQSEQVEHTLIRCYSLGDLEDFAELALTGQDGVNAGDALPPYAALNFTLRPASRAIRPGSKRIAGIPESGQVNGVVTLPAYIANIENYRAELSLNIQDEPSSPEYAPVIVKRVKYVAPSGRDAYRFPVTEGELVVTTVTAALANLTLSHQVSRGNAR